MCLYLDDETALKWTCKNSNQVEMQVFLEPASEQDCSTAPIPSYKLLVSHGARYELVGGQIDGKVAEVVGMGANAFEVRFRKSTCKTHTTTITEKCPICGENKKGKLNCCNKGGSWQGKCADFGEKEYTWDEGAKACQNVSPKPPKPPATPSLCL